MNILEAARSSEPGFYYNQFLGPSWVSTLKPLPPVAIVVEPSRVLRDGLTLWRPLTPEDVGAKIQVTLFGPEKPGHQTTVFMPLHRMEPAIVFYPESSMIDADSALELATDALGRIVPSRRITPAAIAPYILASRFTGSLHEYDYNLVFPFAAVGEPDASSGLVETDAGAAMQAWFDPRTPRNQDTRYPTFAADMRAAADALNTGLDT